MGYVTDEIGELRGGKRQAGSRTHAWYVYPMPSICPFGVLLTVAGSLALSASIMGFPDQ